MSVRKANILRFFIISLLGVLLHFTYEWSGRHPLVATFSAVNESTWEHLKLLFFPMLALTLWEFFQNSAAPAAFLSARTLGILSGMLFIVVVFYTSWGILGKPYEFINILIYFLGVIFALWTENKALKKTACLDPYTAAAILIFLTGAFFIFTFRAPDAGIFYDLAKPADESILTLRKP